MTDKLTKEQREIEDFLALLYAQAPADRHDRLSAMIGEVYGDLFAKAWPGKSDEQIRENLRKLILAVVARGKQFTGGGTG